MNSSPRQSTQGVPDVEQGARVLSNGGIETSELQYDPVCVKKDENQLQCDQEVMLVGEKGMRMIATTAAGLERK